MARDAQAAQAGDPVPSDLRADAPRASLSCLLLGAMRGSIVIRSALATNLHDRFAASADAFRSGMLFGDVS